MPGTPAAPRPEGPGAFPLAAIAILGCRVCIDASGGLAPSALQRRVETGARTYFDRGESRMIVVVSGGRRWGELVEADSMARELSRLGVPERAIVRERCSLSTRENALFTAEALRRRGIARAAVVTCPWHLARAASLFAKAGVDVEPVAAQGGGEVPAWPSRLWRWGVERVLTRVRAEG